eukprot:6445934-Pyramimonas_sp.AAC.1
MADRQSRTRGRSDSLQARAKMALEEDCLETDGGCMEGKGGVGRWGGSQLRTFDAPGARRIPDAPGGPRRFQE